MWEPASTCCAFTNSLRSRSSSAVRSAGDTAIVLTGVSAGRALTVAATEPGGTDGRVTPTPISAPLLKINMAAAAWAQAGNGRCHHRDEVRPAAGSGAGVREDATTW